MTVNGLIDYNEIEEEISVFIKNQDVISTAVRGVTNTQDTGSWSGATSHLINRSNVRNIRSITVGGSPLSFGTDYTVDYFFNDSGTYKCKITLNASQTGTYIIDYDYGSSDKIFTNWPQGNLTISAYPRIIVEITNSPTIETSIDALENRSTFLITVSIMSASKSDINTYIKSIRKSFLENKRSFFYIPFITPITVGPLLPQPAKSDKIFLRTIELEGSYKEEVVS